MLCPIFLPVVFCLIALVLALCGVVIADIFKKR